MEPLTDTSVLPNIAAVAAALHECRLRAGTPSFSDITRRVVQLRRARGLPPGEAHVGRVTVYDCFREDRKRLDSELVIDIVQALGGTDADLRRWRVALRGLHQPNPAVGLVSVADDVPARTETFVGRDDEVAELLDTPGSVWVSGMPGVGKSELTFRAARELVESDAVRRVLVVDLRGHNPGGPAVEPAAAIDALLRSCGVNPGRLPADVDRAALLGRRLAEEHVLLILDDAADSEQTAFALKSWEGVRVWVTSRSMPEADVRQLSLEPFGVEDSVDLLAAHVGRKKVDGDRPAAEAVAESAGHLPLAVQIAATRLADKPDWSLQDHVEFIRQRHKVLRLDPPVQRTFSMSYHALPSPARILLRLIAVHRLAQIDGTSAFALAEGVIDDPQTALRVLTERHMLTTPRDGWYGIHELVRLHVEDLSLDEDAPAWRRAAARRLVTSLLARAWGAYRTRTLAMGEVPREPGIPLAEVAMDPATAEAFFRETTDLLLLAAHEAGVHLTDRPTAALISETLSAWLDHNGRFRDAHLLHEEALRGAREAGDEAGELRARLDLGMRLTAVGRYADSEPHLRAAAAMTDGDAREGVSVYNALGIVCERTGNVAEAEGLYHRSAELAQEIGDARRRGHALNNLAGLYMRTGRLDECQATLLRSIELAEGAGDHVSVARGLVNLSDVEFERGEPARAETSATEALGYFERLDQVPGVVICCSNLAAATRVLGRHDEAVGWAERGLRLSREIGMRQHETTLHARMSAALLDSGDPTGARASAESALAVAEEIGDPYATVLAHLALGDALIACGDTDEAREHWESSLRQADELAMPEAGEIRERLGTLG